MTPTLLAGADACDYRSIPGTVEVVFGYLQEPNQPCGWPSQAWTAFKGKRLYRITRTANPLADVFDIERGTADVTDVQVAVDKRLAAFLPSIVYCSLSAWEGTYKVLNRAVAWWIADWTGVAHLPAAPWDKSLVAQACQYKALPSYDLSVVAPGFPLV